MQVLHDRNVFNYKVDQSAYFLGLRQRTVCHDYFDYERVQGTRKIDSVYTYFVKQFLKLFILSYLKMYVLQEPSAKGTAVTSTLEKLVHCVILYGPYSLFA